MSRIRTYACRPNACRAIQQHFPRHLIYFALNLLLKLSIVNHCLQLTPSTVCAFKNTSTLFVVLSFTIAMFLPPPILLEMVVSTSNISIFISSIFISRGGRIRTCESPHPKCGAITGLRYTPMVPFQCFIFRADSFHGSINCFKGDRWGSNPRSHDPQSCALTD